MEKYEIEKSTHERGDKDNALKIILWLTLICVSGMLICFILSILKIAVQAMVWIGVVLLIFTLIGMLMYNKTKVRILRDENNRIFPPDDKN